MIARLFVSLAYFLDAFTAYKNTKQFIYNLLENPKSKIKPYFDGLIIFLVFITVFILIYSIAHELPDYVEIIEDIAVSIFIFEWLGRFWISADLRHEIIRYHEKKLEEKKHSNFIEILMIILVQKLKFIFSPMSIIDLLAILPAYRPLRILRIFLIFRLLKIFRYTKSLNSFFKILNDKKFEFNFLFLVAIFFIFMSSTTMYVFEGIGNNPNINSYVDTVYWAIITMATVGYGDITPVTLNGKIVTLFLVVGGFFILVLATSVVTNALSEKMEIVRENKLLSQANKLSNLIVIFGFGRMGQTLAQALRKERKRFVIIDKNEQSISRAKELGYLFVKADAGEYEVIEKIVFKNDVAKVVITTENDALNLSILLTIKAENNKIEVIVRANSDENIKKFKIAKADFVIFPYETVAEMAVEYIGSAVKFDAIDNILLHKSSITLDEIDIHDTTEMVGKTLAQIGLEKLSIQTIAVLKEGGIKNFIFNPDPDTYKIELNDSLVVIGEEKNILQIKKNIARQLT
ncbi:MAG: NAD-binding protein [Sulfurospirillum sp.]|nr:NAD-binding protein [Sulfurospirillum sp.]